MKIVKLSLKLLKNIIIGVLAVVLLLNIIGIVKKIFFKEQIPLVFGFGNAVILTGSMEPALASGDIVIIQRHSDYEAGDIVTYTSNTCITHRIVQKTPTGYITKGDANNTPDQEIEQSRVIGKVIKIIPKAGHAILFLQSPLGLLILISAMFAIELPILLKGKPKKSR